MEFLSNGVWYGKTVFVCAIINILNTFYDSVNLLNSIFLFCSVSIGFFFFVSKYFIWTILFLWFTKLLQIRWFFFSLAFYLFCQLTINNFCWGDKNFVRRKKKKHTQNWMLIAVFIFILLILHHKYIMQKQERQREREKAIDSIKWKKKNLRYKSSVLKWLFI